MTKSETLFEQACKVIPGGVNSPVRAFNGVGGTPVFFERAEGAYMYDVDGKAYIDYVGSWGPMICGHANAEIIDAVIETVRNGLSFGAPTQVEVELAEQICTRYAEPGSGSYDLFGYRGDHECHSPCAWFYRA